MIEIIQNHRNTQHRSHVVGIARSFTIANIYFNAFPLISSHIISSRSLHSTSILFLSSHCISALIPLKFCSFPLFSCDCNPFSYISFFLLPFPFHLLSCPIISSISFHALPYGIIAMQYAVPFMSFIPAHFISNHLSSFHVISIQLHFCLIYFSRCSSFQMIKQSGMMRIIKHDHGLQSTSYI